MKKKGEQKKKNTERLWERNKKWVRLGEIPKFHNHDQHTGTQSRLRREKKKQHTRKTQECHNRFMGTHQSVAAKSGATNKRRLRKN